MNNRQAWIIVFLGAVCAVLAGVAGVNAGLTWSERETRSPISDSGSARCAALAVQVEELRTSLERLRQRHEAAITENARLNLDTLQALDRVVTAIAQLDRYQQRIYDHLESRTYTVDGQGFTRTGSRPPLGTRERVLPPQRNGN